MSSSQLKACHWLNGAIWSVVVLTWLATLFAPAVFTLKVLMLLAVIEGSATLVAALALFVWCATDRRGATGEAQWRLVVKSEGRVLRF
jgi:hypothetical protein